VSWFVPQVGNHCVRWMSIQKLDISTNSYLSSFPAVTELFHRDVGFSEWWVSSLQGNLEDVGIKLLQNVSTCLSNYTAFVFKVYLCLLHQIKTWIFQIQGIIVKCNTMTVGIKWYLICKPIHVIYSELEKVVASCHVPSMSCIKIPDWNEAIKLLHISSC